MDTLREKPYAQLGEPALGCTAIHSLVDSISLFRPEDLALTTQKAARRCLVDLFGAAIAGATHPAARAGRTAARILFPGTTTTLFGADTPASIIGAAFSNSMAASILDIDDGHRLACGHPGAAIIPAVLAVAEELDSSDATILAAITLGYEIGIRVAAARRRTPSMSISTGRWAGMGVVAAVGWLRNITSATLTHALAIAEVLSPNLLAADLSGYLGSETKEGIPWSVVTGLGAVALAESGISGYVRAFDLEDLYVPGQVASAFDKRFLIETVYFKPYGCCRWIHSAVDALTLLMQANDIRSDEIDEILVQTFSAARTLNNLPDPPDVVSAQFSMPYILAIAAVDGVSALQPLTEATLGRDDLVHLARRISITVDPTLDSKYPAATPCCLTVKSRGNVFQRNIHDATGDVAAPLSDEQLEAKFRKLSGPVLTPDEQDSILDAVHGRRGSLLNTLKTSLRGRS